MRDKYQKTYDNNFHSKKLFLLHKKREKYLNFLFIHNFFLTNEKKEEKKNSFEEEVFGCCPRVLIGHTKRQKGNLFQSS